MLVVFGRPKGDRGSYLQWKEANISPQVVFEILSPSNTPLEMTRKFGFYSRYGVEEYYEYDPDRGELNGWHRTASILEPIPEMNGWTSPRLGVRFELQDGELVLYHPDGTRFETFIELSERAEREQQRAEKPHHAPNASRHSYARWASNLKMEPNLQQKNLRAFTRRFFNHAAGTADPFAASANRRDKTIRRDCHRYSAR